MKIHNNIKVYIIMNIKYGLFILCLLMVCYFRYLCIHQLKKHRKIPKVIHKIYIQHDNQFGHIPPEIQEAHASWKQMNPDYTLKLYNGHDCERYLLTHFGRKHLQTYNNINAYSGKCNFMRTCIVYNEGGWYSDWKTVCLKPLDTLINDKTQLVLSHDSIRLKNEYNRTFIMTNFFGSVSKHSLFKESIKDIMKHVETRFYGDCPLDTTATGCLGKSYDKIIDYDYNDSIIEGQFDEESGCTIFFNDAWVLHKCVDCEKGQNWANGNNYNDFWHSRTYYR